MSNSLSLFAKKAERVIERDRPRLCFLMDATWSRAGTWELARKLQREMFAAADGKLQVQLVFFRGAGECNASAFEHEAKVVADLMEGVDCMAGNTQIARVLHHVVDEHTRGAVAAFVFVGDTVEGPDHAAAPAAAKILGDLGVPGFFFQEGTAFGIETEFRRMAELSKGAYAHFDANAGKTLGDLLNSVAAYASGGLRALEKQGTAAARLLLTQLKKD